MKVKVKANKKFEGIKDAERNVYPKAGEEWETSLERAEYLEEKGVVEILEEVKVEETIEIEDTPKEIKKKKTIKKKKGDINERTS